MQTSEPLVTAFRPFSTLSMRSLPGSANVSGLPCVHPFSAAFSKTSRYDGSPRELPVGTFTLGLRFIVGTDVLDSGRASR